jgi:peptidyl-prolyl cis-trans isomerase C
MIHRQLDTVRGISEAQVRMYTGRWVNMELLYQEAKRQGLDNDEQVLQSLEEAKKQLAINALLEKEVFTDAPSAIPYDAVTRYFRSHLAEFTLTSDVVWISFAVFTERSPAEAFRSSALKDKGWRQSLDGVKGSPAFITKSDSVFYTSASLYPTELWKVSLALGDGEVSFPVKTSAGYFVILSLGNFTKGDEPPLQYIEDNIRNRLLMEQRQERYAEYLESLRRRHTVQINLAGFPSGTDTLLRNTE